MAVFLAGLMAGFAVLLLVLGVVPSPPSPRPPETIGQIWSRVTNRPTGRAGRRRDLIWAAALLAGIVAGGVTGWIALAGLVPAMVIVAPKLLGQSPQTDIPLLEALDRWIRNIATILPQGRDVVTAIHASRRSAPPLISEEVTTLAQRLNVGMTPSDALQMFADDLDNAEADTVVASLQLATARPQGASANLVAIAANLQDRLRVLRDIEADRAKPRRTSRTVTLISLVMLGGLAMLAPQFLTPLADPFPGQVIVAIASLCYISALILMYRITIPRRRARILVRRSR